MRSSRGPIMCRSRSGPRGIPTPEEWVALECAGSAMLAPRSHNRVHRLESTLPVQYAFVGYKHFVRAPCVHVSRAYASGTCGMGARRVMLGAAVVAAALLTLSTLPNAERDGERHCIQIAVRMRGAVLRGRRRCYTVATVRRVSDAGSHLGLVDPFRQKVCHHL